MGTYGKQKETSGFAWEATENARRTQVLRKNLLTTQSKHRCCVGTYAKRKDYTGVALEPIENVRKTQVLIRNLL